MGSLIRRRVPSSAGARVSELKPVVLGLVSHNAVRVCELHSDDFYLPVSQHSSVNTTRASIDANASSYIVYTMY